MSPPTSTHHLPPSSRFPLRGVIPYPGIPPAVPEFYIDTPLLPATAEVRGWADYCNPSDDQGQEPSCVARAWCGWLEAMLRKSLGQSAIPFGYQLDAHAVWVRGRELFWGGKLDNGLYVDQGLAALKNLGIMPRSACLVRIQDTWDNLGAALQAAPVVQAHAVSAGWNRPSRVNGGLDESCAPSGSRYGFHCTLCLERLVQNERPFRFSANSWGDWGYHGHFLMSEEYHQLSAMPASLYSAWLPGDWSDARGWEEWLVKVPSTLHLPPSTSSTAQDAPQRVAPSGGPDIRAAPDTPRAVDLQKPAKPFPCQPSMPPVPDFNQEPRTKNQEQFSSHPSPFSLQPSALSLTP